MQPSVQEARQPAEAGEDTEEPLQLINMKGLQDRLGIGSDKAYELVHMENFPSRKIKDQWRTDWGAVKRDFRTAPQDVKDLAEVWR